MEIWKDIVGVAGYQISSLGNIKSKEKTKTICDLGHWRHTHQIKLRPLTYKQKFLKPSVDGAGYKHVRLRLNDGGYRLYKVHRLVAEYFLPDYNQDYMVVHKDGDHLNNTADNLQIKPVSKKPSISKAYCSKHLYKCLQTGEEFCSFKQFSRRNNLNYSRYEFIKSLVNKTSYMETTFTFIKIR